MPGNPLCNGLAVSLKPSHKKVNHIKTSTVQIGAEYLQTGRPFAEIRRRQIASRLRTP
jgi:hypothetical protein